MSEPTRTLHVAEPPAQYLVLPPVVVDCSALAGLLFLEPWHTVAAERIQGRRLHAPYLLQAEVASVALKKHRQGSADTAIAGLQRFAETRLDLHATDPRGVYDLGHRYQLSAYDAAYLWLAEELKAPLVTFDEKLAAAAKIHLAGLS